MIVLSMEAARNISETSVTLYKTTRSKIPEDSHLYLWLQMMFRELRE